MQATALLSEGEEAQGFSRLRDPVVIPPKELKRQGPGNRGAGNKEAQEEAMEGAQPIEEERRGDEKDMEFPPEDDAEIASASMGALTLPAAEEGGGTPAGLDTARGLALLNPSADVPATEPRQPCAAQSCKEVSTRAAQVPTLLPAGREPLMEKRHAQAIFGARTSREFFSCKNVSPPNDAPGGASSDAALSNWLTQKAKDNSTIRDGIEPPKPPSTGSSGTQQMHKTREEERDDYASGIIFSSLHDVGRHLMDLVVKRLIMSARRPKAWRTSLRVDFGMGVLEKPLKHWAPYKRHAHLPLPGGLCFLQRNGRPAGLLLCAMTVYDETHLRALTIGAFEPDGGGPSKDNDDDDEGFKSKRKRRVRAALRAVSGTTTLGEQPQKRKATADTGEGSRGAKAAKLETAKKERPSALGITVSAVVGKTCPATSASHAGEWDNAIQQALTGPGTNFQRMQGLVGQLQHGLPAGQPAHGLPLDDFLGLQLLLANWEDPAPVLRLCLVKFNRTLDSYL
jgi:hypothetical protein